MNIQFDVQTFLVITDRDTRFGIKNQDVSKTMGFLIPVENEESQKCYLANEDVKIESKQVL